MTKVLTHNALDAAFAYVAARGDTLALCAGAPATASEATMPIGEGGKMLSKAAMAPGLGNGDYITAPGAASGRRLVVDAKNDVTVTGTGTADHLALVDTAGEELLLVTPLETPQSLISGAVIAVKGFSDEIADPV